MNKKRFNYLTITGSTLLLTLGLVASCTTKRYTTTVRTATEQILLSTAVDHALQHIGLDFFSGRKVFLDGTYFDSYDPKYALGTIRDALSRAGALLVESANDSEIVVEARSGALAIDDADALVGIPSMPVPVPLAGVLQTPEVAFYGSKRQRSVAKIALLAYARQSRAHIYSSGPLDGKSFDNSYKVFFVSWVHTDLPEKHDQVKSPQYQTWVAQYDLSKLPSTNQPAESKPALKVQTFGSTNAPGK